MAKGKKNERSIDEDPTIIEELEKTVLAKLPKRRGADPNREHYIDNDEFFKEMVTWKKEIARAKKEGLPIPRVTESIGQKILTIATRVSFMPKFVNYPFREEMISDGVENCLLYIQNFNPKKSNKPFAYFTTIVYYAFLRRIKKEKAHLATKFKYIEEHLNGELENGDVPGDSFGSDYSDANRREFMHNFEQARAKKKKKKRIKTNVTALDQVLEE